MPKQRIEATVTIAEDRQLILQLPDSIHPGEHRVIVTLDEPESEMERISMICGENDILIFNGAVEGSFENFLNHVREERLRQFLPTEAHP
jgi:hypothetical protein